MGMLDAPVTVAGLAKTPAGKKSLTWERSKRQAKSMLLAANSVPVASAPPTITLTQTVSSSFAIPIKWDSWSGPFTYWPVAVSKFSGDNSFVQSKQSTSYHLNAEFFVNDVAVEIYLLAYNSNLDVYVNDELIDASGYSLGASGQPYILKLDWGSSRATRHIRVSGQNLLFGGVWTSNKGSIFQVPYYGPTVAFFGDSYTDGTGATKPTRNYVASAMVAMGVRCWGQGAGGKGWLSGSPDDVSTRVANWVAAFAGQPAPDIIVSAYGYNDSTGNMTTLDTNYRLWVDLVKAAFPLATIVTLGPWTPLGSTTNLTNVKNTLQTAAVAKGVAFIDIENIINSANKQDYTGGDNTHPNAAGHAYLGQRIGHLLLHSGLV